MGQSAQGSLGTFRQEECGASESAGRGAIRNDLKGKFGQMPKSQLKLKQVFGPGEETY